MNKIHGNVNNAIKKMIRCPECDGAGTVEDKPCSECQSKGFVEAVTIKQ